MYSVKKNMEAHLLALSALEVMPPNHIAFLHKLKNEMNFHPKVIYDIGACVCHWTHAASKVWDNAEYVLFDAFQAAEFLYKPYKHHVGVLSDSDDAIVKFYENPYSPGGNSYYREIGCASGDYFPEDVYTCKKTSKLDTVVRSKQFPLPDLVKIDVQGSELDVINGGLETIKSAKYLIVELQHTQYNRGAPRSHISKPYIESLGWKCIAERFQDNGCDADYCFENTAASQSSYCPPR
jgi:FkbM family methyltransferase